MSEDLGSKTKSSLIWSTSLKVAYQAFTFIMSIVIARILDPKDYGIISVATMVIFYANNITHFGLNVALIQRKEINENHINSVFTVTLAIAISLAAGCIFLSPHIATFFNVPELKNVFRVLSPLFIILAFHSLPSSLMERELNYKVVAVAGFYQGILSSSVALTLAIYGFQYWSLVIGFIVSYTAGTLYILVKVDWKPKIKYNHKAMKEILSFGVWNLVRSQTFHINDYADKFIIGKFLGPVLLGIYDKAFSTAAMIRQSFTMQFNAVMFSSFSRLQSEENERIKMYLKKALTISTLITFPLCMGLIGVGSHFVLILLGDKWAAMIVPLKILSIALIFNSLAELMSNLNVGMGFYKNQTVRDASCNVLVIGVCLMLVQRGINAVAVGILCVYCVVFMISFLLSRQKINVRFGDLIHSVSPALIGSLTMLLVIKLTEKMFLPDVNVTSFVLLTAIGGVTYLLIVFVLPGFPILEEYRMSSIAKIKQVVNGLYARAKG